MRCAEETAARILVRIRQESTAVKSNSQRNHFPGAHENSFPALLTPA
jgi:hypothetical protein